MVRRPLKWELKPSKRDEQCAEYPNQGQRGRKEGEWFVDGLVGVENEVSNAK